MAVHIDGLDADVVDYRVRDGQDGRPGDRPAGSLPSLAAPFHQHLTYARTIAVAGLPRKGPWAHRHRLPGRQVHGHRGRLAVHDMRHRLYHRLGHQVHTRRQKLDRAGHRGDGAQIGGEPAGHGEYVSGPSRDGRQGQLPIGAAFGATRTGRATRWVNWRIVAQAGRRV